MVTVLIVISAAPAAMVVLTDGHPSDKFSSGPLCWTGGPTPSRQRKPPRTHLPTFRQKEVSREPRLPEASTPVLTHGHINERLRIHWPRLDHRLFR